MRVLWLIFCCMSVFALARPSQADEPIALKVLYAGNPGSDREKDFTTFFGKWFAKVGSIDYRTFKKDDAKGYDVVILDWTSIYPRDEHGKVKPQITGINAPTPPRLPLTYDRPTILIGAAGGYATNQLQLKINWL